MNENDKSDYKKDLDIDLMSLEKEWLQQPKLYMKYAELAAQAKRDLDRTHEKVKVIRSEITKELKKEDSKITGPLIEAGYRTDPRHQEAKEEMIEAEYEYNIMNSAVFAFQQRKSALEDEVRLWQGSYFAGPRVDEGPASEHWNPREQAQMKKDARVSDRRTKMKRGAK